MMGYLLDAVNLLSEKWLLLMWRITWQGGAFIAVVFLITKVFRGLSPTIKHLLWMLVIVKFLIMPFVTVPLTFSALPMRVEQPVAESSVPETLLPSSETETISGQAISMKRTLPRPTIYFSLWALGVTMLILGIIVRYLRCKKNISTAKVLRAEDILDMAAAGAKQLGIKPPVLKTSDKFSSPLACGILRPTLIFPEHIIEQFSPSELNTIINHELAHIKRLDILTNWFQMFAQVFYFFNPLVWYANRQVRLEREQACDDWVLEIGRGDRRVYADALLKVVELCSREKGFALGIVGVTEPFALMARRLKMIVDRGRRISTRLSVGVMVGLVVIGLVGIPAYIRAASAPSSAKAELMRRVEDFFLNNFRDVTARKSIEWGEVAKHENGNQSIRYKYYATIRDKEILIMNQVFTFDPKGDFVSVKQVEGFPKKKEKKVVDTNTKEGMIDLVEDFFRKNFIDVTWRKTIEWGEVVKHENGNSSIRYKYHATIWDKDRIINNQVFTFDPKGGFVSVKDVGK